MKIKTAVGVDAKPAKLVMQFRCGDCVHHKHYAKFEKPCEKLGVTKHRLAPDCFTPNVFALQKIVPDILNQFGLLVKDFTPSMARILMALLYRRKAYARYGLGFGMPVYICLGGDFLNNYYRGFVIGAGGHGQRIIYVTSDMNKRQVNNPAILAVFPESVYTVSRFKKKKADLIADKKLNDPKSVFANKKKPVADINYEPPMMENVPASWFDVYSKASQKESKVKKTKGGLEMRIDR